MKRPLVFLGLLCFCIGAWILVYLGVAAAYAWLVGIYS